MRVHVKVCVLGQQSSALSGFLMNVLHALSIGQWLLSIQVVTSSYSGSEEHGNACLRKRCTSLSGHRSIFSLSSRTYAGPGPARGACEKREAGCILASLPAALHSLLNVFVFQRSAVRYSRNCEVLKSSTSNCSAESHRGLSRLRLRKSGFMPRLAASYPLP
jgi:hypothetical protein